LKSSPSRNNYLLPAALLLIMLMGCGFKGNPAPYSMPPVEKQVIEGLEAFSTEKAVKLQWRLNDKNEIINSIDIERSEAGTPGNECKNCPRTFTKIGRISVKAETTAEKKPEMLSFTDINVERGKIYGYRLLLCEGNGNCSEASTIEVNFK
jgi:predicted small lipoprotein YifL